MCRSARRYLSPRPGVGHAYTSRPATGPRTRCRACHPRPLRRHRRFRRGRRDHRLRRHPAHRLGLERIRPGPVRSLRSRLRPALLDQRQRAGVRPADRGGRHRDHDDREQLDLRHERGDRRRHLVAQRRPGLARVRDRLRRPGTQHRHHQHPRVRPGQPRRLLRREGQRRPRRRPPALLRPRRRPGHRRRAHRLAGHHPGLADQRPGASTPASRPPCTRPARPPPSPRAAG